jgi:1-acyl-sn-glycerol-3-phosphate acyltransferase
LAPRASDGSLRRLFEIVEQDLAPLAPQAARAMIDKLRGAASEDLLDPDTWRGLWLLMSYSMAQPTGWIKRRVTGDYETDEWGFDPEVAQAIRPLLELLYRKYWRVEVTGLEAIPDEGRSLLVSNHSGQLPWDGAMIGTAIHLDHPAHRLVRSLYDTWFPSLPVFSTLLTKLGQTLASVENGTRLLEEDELVAVFPEGTKGVGKLYRERYRLQRFGRGGFVRMALRTRAPMVPVAVVGAEETYVSLYKSETIARLIGFPFFPISLTWPWLGPLGFVPMPTKWYIDFGDPIRTESYGDAAADDLVTVSRLADQTRNRVQEMLYERLAARRSVFMG